MASIFDIFNLNKEPKPQETGNEVPLGINTQNDPAQTIATNSEYGNAEFENTVLSFFETFNDEEELIKKYDSMALNPYINDALADILDEIIVYERNKNSIELNLDALENKELSKQTKKKFLEEFDYILNLLDFNRKGYDLVKDWYIRGKQYHYPVVDVSKKSIIKIVQLAQQNVKQINHVKYKQVEHNNRIIKTVESEERFYIYKLQDQKNNSLLSGHWVESEEAFKFKKENIIQVDSGIYDKDKSLIYSNLHYAIKPYNQLTQSEDAMVIYRMVRAPEKRAFYIDVGNMGKQAAERYINQFIAKFKTAQNYNSATGKLHVGSKGVQSIYSDYWLPRKGNQSSNIETLDSAQNLGELTDIEYLQKQLYTSLKIPNTRLDPEARFSLGRAAEIERDEFKFHNFIERVRNRYSELFIQLLRTQLHLKEIILKEDFDQIKNKIFIDWLSDNFYEEIKQQEILAARLETISNIEGLEGEYFTEEYIHKNILMRTDEEYDEFINNKKDAENSDGELEDELE